MIPLNPSAAEPENLKDHLLARLSSEVRDTLHQILGGVEIISGEPLSRQQTKHLDRCRESARELLRIANDVSELADFGPFHETPSAFELSRELEQFGTLVGIRAAHKKLDLQWRLDDRIPRVVLGCRRAIEDALYRVVDNSIKFTERGGLTIAVTLKSHGHLSSEISIEVSDTGPGIAQEVVADFHRPVSESRNKGLGLRIARKRLAEIGGRLDVVSCNARGSTLAIVFPVATPADESKGDSVFEGGHNLRLLVAEDCDDSFALFDTFVQDEGHRITRAMNGAEAVEMFKTGTFDMVVMDINMPVMDGYTATRLIREWETQHSRPRMPILLLSADSAGRLMRMGSSVGCSGYLTKPTPKEELLSALRHYSGATS